MSIFRSTNPADFDDVDGIIINESAPSPNIQGSPSNIAIMVAQTQRGPIALTDVGSIGEFHQLYGKSSLFGGNVALKNKKFGKLRVIRVAATGSAVATKSFNATATPIISFTAKQGNGAYGNSLQVTIAAGTVSGKKYTLHDSDPNAVLPDEVYDNVAVANVVANATFANSQLVTASVLATSAEPDNTTGASNLAGGLDGTAVDTDYQAAIALAGVEGAGNFLFLDTYNTARNNYLLQHAAATEDKMVIVAGQQNDSVSIAQTDVALNRDVDGRVIYAYPWVQTSIDGVLQMTSPASWMASILSQTNPSIDPAFVQNSKLLAGVTGLQFQLTRAQYISLVAAGIAAFAYDSDIGYLVKSGVVTQISDSSKITILRRRMADFLTQSAGKFLKNYQNAVNSRANRAQVKGAFLNFIQAQESAGVLPRDSEVKSGKAKIVDTESLNTDSSIAAGFFKILWRQRIYSSMRYIVLQAEIGQSVVVTEGQ